MAPRHRTTAFLAALALVALTGTPVGPARAAAFDLTTEQWALADVRAPGAWTAGYTGRGVVVAVVDSGVDADHPEFSGRLVAGASCVGAGTASASACSTSRSQWDDPHGHGTHVAGIVAAAADGRGVTGVAPAASIMPVRVLEAAPGGRLQARAADVAAGIRYAVDHGADVVNLSLSALPVVSQLSALGVLDPRVSAAIEDAARRGVVLVAAAGNESFPVCNHKVFRSSAGLCVGSLDRRGTKAEYSNFGAALDLVAPGGSEIPLCSERILSTHLADRRSDCAVPRGYDGLAGTSMAAPHVAAVAALSIERGISARTVADWLRSTADDRGPRGYDGVFGYGMVDARRAVT
ncbi:MAG TPA: S8 family serine peptidase [Acidimicrobiia bacterium]|nr:S8 family serine peptidase [Acidimicrobiia bacterium]